MNITKPLLCQNRHPFRFDKLCALYVYTSFLLLFVCSFPLILDAEDAQTETSTATTSDGASITGNDTQETDDTESTDTMGANDDSVTEPTTEKITGTSKRMERYEKEGITILIDEAKTVRYDEQDVEIGFLNADKITLKTDLETGATTEIIAVGNVEIRDQDIFATCDHAIMNNLTNTVVLKDNVVVLQNKDRLETKLFTFNRTTGKQIGEGGVKFKVTVTQATPVEADENAEGSASTDEEGASTDTPDQTNTDAETPNTDGTTEEVPGIDTENAEGADSVEETNTDTEEPEDPDANAETEESESN